MANPPRTHTTPLPHTRGGTETGAGTETGTETGTGAGRVRTVGAAALADEARVTLTAVALTTEWDIIGRWDDDDYADEDDTPDLAEPDDDEPDLEQSDERSLTLPDRPEIVFWNGPEGTIEWEVRPTSAALLDDHVLAGPAVYRRELLERFARGLARDLLTNQDGPIDLTLSLAEIWDRLPARGATSTQDKSLLKDWSELSPSERLALAPDGERLAIEERGDATGLELRWGTYQSSLSKERDLLIGLSPELVVPLAFFTWKPKPREISEEGSRRALAWVLEQEARNPEITKAELTRLWAQDAKNYPGHLLDWVRAVKAHPDLVSRYRTMLWDRPVQFERVVGAQKRPSPFLLELREAERRRLASRPPGLDPRHAWPVLFRALVGGIT